MQESWILGGATLLSIFQAVRGNDSIERSSFEHRTTSFSQRWPGVLSGLTAGEAAMLQDLAWWGPLMENRLKQLAGSRAETRTIR